MHYFLLKVHPLSVPALIKVIDIELFSGDMAFGPFTTVPCGNSAHKTSKSVSRMAY